IKDLHRMQRLARTVEQRGLAPEKIILEITEDCVVGRGTSNVPEILQIMRAHSFRISFDDFGTGYASLTHLKDLPVDEIKLDRSFICDLMANASDHSIVLAMINLAKSLGLTTVAEGIEQPEQHNILLAMGCDTGQGYFYGHPVDFESATDYLRGATENNLIEPRIESSSVANTPATGPNQLSDPAADAKLRITRQS
ncbi:MAG: EAL domain-containing protein, partial [Fimbriimonadaceae bacterium]|nr:EAL domain-containing protein [Alphaproteobacteria bacterium]